ncbi:hypothetical protein [Aeromonas salmonicida]|uniref:hypothetical protein n=1 Tax=Aeromonas salmonicida TaxID=645 RepID=UPI003D70DA7E
MICWLIWATTPQDGHQATSMSFITGGMDDFVNAAPLWSWQGQGQGEIVRLQLVK